MKKIVIIWSFICLVLLVCSCKKGKEVALFPVKKNGKWGYIDRSGKIIIPPQFDYAWFFSEGLAPVKIGRKWGYIDKSGKIVIEPRFDWAESFSEGLAGVCIGNCLPAIERGYMKFRGVYLGYWGYIDKSGKYIWEPTE